ncbi:23888_t:CDS:2, partial [Racocetra persica]
HKIGKLGENVFVWHDKCISNENGWTNMTPEFEKIISPSSILLFRYSALTFNSHRIHYDHIYSTKAEGYPGYLVHGPLTCTFLLDLVRDNLPSTAYIRSFSYRALSPLYVGEEFKLCGSKSDINDKSFDVWAENIQGGVAMKGTAMI